VGALLSGLRDPADADVRRTREARSLVITRRVFRRCAVVPALLAAAMVLLSACGGGDHDEAATVTVTGTPTATLTTATTTAPTTTTSPPSGTTTTSPPSGTATAPPANGIDTIPGASTRPVIVAATNTSTALLTQVRAARHEGYDRVVFQFRDELPGYDVRYVPRPVREDGSGRAVTVAGAFVVRVRMENALDADLAQEDAPPTYTGPTRIAPGTPEVRELVRAGGFEGVLTWAIGVDDRVDFRVLTLDDPPRLVIDLGDH
jgi:hypothetical protein